MEHSAWEGFGNVLEDFWKRFGSIVSHTDTNRGTRRDGHIETHRDTQTHGQRETHKERHRETHAET